MTDGSSAPLEPIDDPRRVTRGEVISLVTAGLVTGGFALLAQRGGRVSEGDPCTEEFLCEFATSLTAWFIAIVGGTVANFALLKLLRVRGAGRVTVFGLALLVWWGAVAGDLGSSRARVFVPFLPVAINLVLAVLLPRQLTFSSLFRGKEYAVGRFAGIRSVVLMSLLIAPPVHGVLHKQIASDRARADERASVARRDEQRRRDENEVYAHVEQANFIAYGTRDVPPDLCAEPTPRVDWYEADPEFHASYCILSIELVSSAVSKRYSPPEQCDYSDCREIGRTKQGVPVYEAFDEFMGEMSPVFTKDYCMVTGNTVVRVEMHAFDRPDAVLRMLSALEPWHPSS